MALASAVTILSLVHDRIRPEKLFKEDTDDPPLHSAPQSSTSWSAELMKPAVVALERPVEDYLRIYASFYNVTQQRAPSGELANNVMVLFGAVKSAGRHGGVHFEVRTIGESEVTSKDGVTANGAPAMLEGHPDMLLDNDRSYSGGQLTLQALLGFFFEAMEDTPRDSKPDGTLGV
ncbi:hypothetical protein D7B24_001904 [Verticillium nonalfalfae]|uniref:Uncharacterized protein n=1 Tax=Verticillium nonalfalfae TaxID=1051616 RepID=A0A3M9Y0J1_9PEZI|nr:uncharacterized protein D7B24_001904 [Verticillium nonalfalfae]RNJ53426.1 hypothetical protein D7B24_001904 [Verticillium nonalfalfae]